MYPRGKRSPIFLTKLDINMFGTIKSTIWKIFKPEIVNSNAYQKIWRMMMTILQSLETQLLRTVLKIRYCKKLETLLLNNVLKHYWNIILLTNLTRNSFHDMRFLSYWNQLYERDLHHERLKICSINYLTNFWEQIK